MPWLTIIMAIIAFFASGGAKKENRTRAALTALGVGAATYATTHYTDWGQENLGFLDGVEFTGTGTDTALTTEAGASIIKPTTSSTGGVGSTTTAGNTGLWNTISSWLSSPAGQATSGAVGAKALGVPNWMILAGVGVAALVIMK